MCEFSNGGDHGADVSDVSTDISDSIDSDLGSENIEIEINDISEDVDDINTDTYDAIPDNISEDLDYIPEDIEYDFSNIDSEDTSIDIDDVSEDIIIEDDDEDTNESFSDTYGLDGDYEYEMSDGYEKSLETIEKNGYEYTIDDEGKVSEVEGDLRLENGERDLAAQREAGGDFRRDTDDGGHFIGNRFNGPGEDINMFAQDSNFNRGGYKSMENEWARELEDGNDVHVKIEPVYQDGTERPHAIMGEYTITEDGNKTKEYFSFTNENLRSDEFDINDDDFEFPEKNERE